jgi:hypothetical protein
MVSTGVNLAISDVPVDFAKTRFSLSPVVLPASMPCGRGLLGADVWDHCVLVWGGRHLWASCHN